MLENSKKTTSSGCWKQIKKPRQQKLKKEGDYNTSISLYLKGGLPAKAANVVSSYNVGVPQD